MARLKKLRRPPENSDPEKTKKKGRGKLESLIKPAAHTSKITREAGINKETDIVFGIWTYSIIKHHKTEPSYSSII
jgi:hypothetical protein